MRSGLILRLTVTSVMVVRRIQLALSTIPVGPTILPGVLAMVTHYLQQKVLIRSFIYLNQKVILK